MANEKRLIDANKIKYTEYRGGGGREYPENVVTEYEIAKMPTVDAVEVVRCKDCIVPHNEWTGCPKLNGLKTTSDFYCPYGKRKENG